MKYTLATVDLYEYTTIGVAKTDSITNQKYSDIEFEKKSFKIFGTPEQVDEYLKDKPVDEIYIDKIEKAGSYYEGICFSETRDDLPTLEEYNTKLQARIDRIEKIYIARGSKVLVQ